MVRLNDFPKLEKVFVDSSLEIVYQVASLVPVVLCSIEHFELYVSRLASLHCGLEFVSWYIFLLWHVLNRGKGSHWIILLCEKGTYPGPEATLLLHFCNLDVIFELHFVLLGLLFTYSPLVLCFSVLRD